MRQPKLKVMKRYKKTLLAAALIATMASCSTEQAVITDPEDVLERIDMVLEGSETEYIFLQSPELQTAEDLIQYNYYGSPSNKSEKSIRSPLTARACEALMICAR